MNEIEQEKATLFASVHDVRYVMALLRGVSFSNRAIVQANSAGLTIIVEEARTLTCTAYIKTELFDEYMHNPISVSPSVDPSQSEDQDTVETTFEIPLHTLIECLNIFGTAGGSISATNSKGRRWRANSEHGEQPEDRPRPTKDSGNGRIDQYFGSDKRTGMRLTYAGEGSPLRLLIAEDANGPTATCDIVTFDPEPIVGLDFFASQSVMNVILKSSWLRDALSELDPSCEKLTIICNAPQPPGRAAQVSLAPRLRLQATGAFGSTEMDYPNDKDVLETCICEEKVKFSYRFSHVARVQRALQNSTKTSLRINEEGMLCIQLMMPTRRPRDDKASQSFIEFRCLPLDEQE